MLCCYRHTVRMMQLLIVIQDNQEQSINICGVWDFWGVFCVCFLLLFWFLGFVFFNHAQFAHKKLVMNFPCY